MNAKSPPILKKTNKFPFHIFDNFIGILLSTIVRIMNKEVDSYTISKVDRGIKLYLASLDNLLEIGWLIKYFTILWVYNLRWFDDVKNIGSQEFYCG